MKTNLPSDHDETLRKVLHDWSVDVPVPPRFQEEVWRRIERAETQTMPGTWLLLKQWIENTMTRPTPAICYVTVLVIGGLLTGFWQAQEKTSQAETNLRTLYVQSADPYQAPRH